MNWITNLLGRASKSFPKRARQPRKVHLNLEQLEDRRQMSVVFHGGDVLPHVQLQSVYFGEAPQSPLERPTDRQQEMDYFDGYFKDIVHSSYMSMLGEYGVGLGSFVGRDEIPQALQLGNGNVSEDDIQSMLAGEILSGRAAAPNANSLYAIVLPAGVHCQFDEANGFFAHHNDFTLNLPDGSSMRVPYFVVDNTATNTAKAFQLVNSASVLRGVELADVQLQTIWASHELTEAVTDPTNKGGWWMKNPNSTAPDRFGLEIGDLAQDGPYMWGMFDGYTVQKEWLNSMNDSFLPTNNAIPSGGDNVGWLLSDATVANEMKYFAPVVDNGHGYLLSASDGVNTYQGTFFHNPQTDTWDFSGWYRTNPDTTPPVYSSCSTDNVPHYYPDSYFGSMDGHTGHHYSDLLTVSTDIGAPA